MDGYITKRRIEVKCKNDGELMVGTKYTAERKPVGVGNKGGNFDVVEKKMGLVHQPGVCRPLATQLQKALKIANIGGG